MIVLGENVQGKGTFTEPETAKIVVANSQHDSPRCTICPVGKPCFAHVKSLLLLSFPAKQQTSGFVVQLISSLTKAFPAVRAKMVNNG